MKTLVCPTDFSELSLNAVNYAASLARVIGTDLSLLHVCMLPVVFGGEATPAFSKEDLIQNAEEEMALLKEKVINNTGGILKVNTEIRLGGVVQEIKDYCTSVNTYAVVMGVESTGSFERFLFGGNTISAIHQLAWPLIVVPPGVQFTRIKKIGLACDFRNVTETIPDKEIKKLVKEFEAELHILHVSEESTDGFNPETVAESGWLQELLGELQPKYDFITGIQMEKSIIEFSEKNAIDLLIVIPKKHNFLTKMFGHSFSKNLVLHSHVPLMSIHE